MTTTLASDTRSARLASLAPPPSTRSRCPHCSRLATKITTGSENRKGNAGRPYYKCIPCNKFLCFIDLRGNDPSNPVCYCGVSSKTQMAGPEKRVSRGLHYVCRLGNCDYNQPRLNNQGQHMMVSTDDLADWLISMKLV